MILKELSLLYTCWKNVMKAQNISCLNNLVKNINSDTVADM